MSLQKDTILVTGAAGFIGASLVKKLLSHGESVVGFDYYSKILSKNT